MTPKFLTSASGRTKLPGVRVSKSGGRAALGGKFRSSALAMPNLSGLFDVKAKMLSRRGEVVEGTKMPRAYGALLVCRAPSVCFTHIVRLSHLSCSLLRDYSLCGWMGDQRHRKVK